MSITLDCDISVLEAYGEVLPLIEDSEDLAIKVMRKIQDASYTYDDILNIFNKGVREISGKAYLPELEVVRDIDTDPSYSYVHAPADYQKNLRYAHSIDYNYPIKVYGSLAQLYSKLSMLDQSGRVIGIAVKGRRIYYQRIPDEAETIRVNYYSYPERMRARYEKPTCIPDHLVEPLLINYACSEIYSEIEDGMEGQKVNTTYYEGKYKEALADLIEFIGPEESIPVEMPFGLDWNAYIQ